MHDGSLAPPHAQPQSPGDEEGAHSHEQIALAHVRSSLRDEGNVHRKCACSIGRQRVEAATRFDPSREACGSYGHRAPPRLYRPQHRHGEMLSQLFGVPRPRIVCHVNQQIGPAHNPRPGKNGKHTLVADEHRHPN